MYKSILNSVLEDMPIYVCDKRKTEELNELFQRYWTVIKNGINDELIKECFVDFESLITECEIKDFEDGMVYGLKLAQALHYILEAPEKAFENKRREERSVPDMFAEEIKKLTAAEKKCEREER